MELIFRKDEAETNIAIFIKLKAFILKWIVSTSI